VSTTGIFSVQDTSKICKSLGSVQVSRQARGRIPDGGASKKLDFYQVRQGRTWSRSYKSPSPPPPSPPPPPPSPPTRFRILVLLHFFNFAIF
jgi:hypothetical protein